MPTAVPPVETAGDLAPLQAAVANRYAIERELGRGGMGVVYLAHDLTLDRRVALKLLPAEFAAQPRLRSRFLQEARLAARLSHPNIVPIHAVEEHPAAVFFAMGYIAGETLAQRIERVGALPPQEVTALLQQVAWALAYAHGRGVVHRDVKPDNILIEEGSGRACVMDFGIARAADPVTGEHEAGPRHTEIGHVVGTAEYMSPEQASGDTVDGRSDLYALGAVGYAALTGQPPFTGPSEQAVLARQVTETAPPVASVRPGIPASLAQVVDRLLAKDPAARLQSGEAVAEALGPATEGQAEIAAPLRHFLRTTDQNRYLAVSLIPMVALAVMRPTVAVPLAFMGLAVIGARAIEMITVARRVYRMGYRFADVSRAARIDRRARAEESRQLAGTLDRRRTRRAVLRGAGLAAGGVAWFTALVLALRLPAAAGLSRGASLAVILVGVVGLLVAMFGIMGAVQVATSEWKLSARADPGGGVWASRLARLLFERAVRGIEPAPAREAGGALDDLLREAARAVPASDRPRVKAAREALDGLAAEIDRLRGRDRELARAAAEAGAEDVTARLATAREQVGAELAARLAEVEALRRTLILVKAGVAPAAELG